MNLLPLVAIGDLFMPHISPIVEGIISGLIVYFITVKIDFKYKQKIGDFFSNSSTAGRLIHFLSDLLVGVIAGVIVFYLTRDAKVDITTHPGGSKDTTTIVKNTYGDNITPDNPNSSPSKSIEPEPSEPTMAQNEGRVSFTNNSNLDSLTIQLFPNSNPAKMQTFYLAKDWNGKDRASLPQGYYTWKVFHNQRVVSTGGLTVKAGISNPVTLSELTDDH